MKLKLASQNLCGRHTEPHVNYTFKTTTHSCPLLLSDQMIRNGDVELQGKEEEIRFLNIQKGEDSRKVDLLRKAVPNKRNLEQELVTLQIQVETMFIIDGFIEIKGSKENQFSQLCCSDNMYGIIPKTSTILDNIRAWGLQGLCLARQVPGISFHGI
jgi:hypothetical protein